MALLEIRQADSEKLFTEVASKIGEFLVLQSSNKQIVVALPGGRSVVKLLDAMLPALRALPQSVRAKLQFFMVDERVAELTSADSNFKMLNELFYSKAIVEELINGSQLHPFEISSEPIENTVKSYGDKLSHFGGVFDLTVLGVGEDAHVAGLFPNHHSVKNTANQFITFTDSPKPPPYRMTASRKLVESSKMAVGLFVGEAKRDALELFRKEDSVENCPAALLKKLPLGIVATDLI
jgi:6-phosphogluconolactonase